MPLGPFAQQIIEIVGTSINNFVENWACFFPPSKKDQCIKGTGPCFNFLIYERREEFGSTHAGVVQLTFHPYPRESSSLVSEEAPFTKS